MIDKGTWAHLEVMSNARNYSSIVNAYGLLRSPWNTNKSPYVGRHVSLNNHSMYEAFPSCKESWACFKSANISVMNRCLNGYTHGPVHIMIGGEWGHEDEGRHSAINQYGLWRSFLLLSKNLWRHGFVRCPSACSDDTPLEAPDSAVGTRRVFRRTTLR